MLGDLNKLKVVELKAELAHRGLDTKGVKAVLVDRLKAALEEEGGGATVGSSVSASEDHRSSQDSNDDAEEVPSTPSRRGRRTSTRDVSSADDESEAATSFEQERVPSPVEEEPVAPLEQEQAAVDAQAQSSAVPDEQASSGAHHEPSEGEDNALIAQDHAVEAQDTVQAEDVQAEDVQAEVVQAEDVQAESVQTETVQAVTAQGEKEEESSESKCSSELPDSSSEVSIVDQPLLEETQPASETMEDHSIQPVEESKSSSAEPIGDSESSNIQEELSLPAEPDEDSQSKDQTEAVQSELTHETEDIKAEPPDCSEVKTEPGLTQDGSEMKEEQADVSRRSRKSRFTDNDDPIQGGTEVKEEPMDTDVSADDASGQVKSESSNDRKRRRSPSRSPRRSRSPQIKRQEDEPEIDDSALLLSWYDSDLNLIIEKDNFLSATPMHQQGFGYIWAGARASFGFTKGKICYEAKCIEECDVSHLEDEPNPHVLRVGWSVQGTSMQLGEEKGSYGYGGTGKSSVNCQFKDYGRTFGAGDTITAYLDMDSEPKILSYSVNGESQGVAYEISSDTLTDKALFPHILSKNMKFSVNFSSEPAYPITEGFTLCGNVPVEDRVAGPRRPEKMEDCEMIMMCGLPGAGKTYWANKHNEENPDKLMNVLGTNNLIDKMKVMGLPRKRNYSGRWEVLIEKCTKCLTKLFEIAGHRRRNYILDQTNVYPSAVRRKMKAFDGFKRRAVVIVPADDEFQRRVAKREAEEGKDVPDSAVLEMKANFKVPEVGDIFSEVIYVELPEEEARALVEKYHEEAKEKGFVAQTHQSKRFKSERAGSSSDRRHDDRHSSRDGRDHRDRGRDYRDNRDGRGDYRDRERNNYRPRGGPNDRSRSGWQPRGGGMQQAGGWRDRNDGHRGNRNESRGQWRSGGGGGRGGMGGGYDRHRGGGYNQNRGGGYGGRGASKGWGYNQGSGGSSWGSWSQPSQDYSQQWQGQSQGQSPGYSASWKGYGQQQQSQQQHQGYGQTTGYTTQGYGNSYGNGSNSYNWNQQYYQNYGSWGQQAGAASVTGASTGTGTSSSAVASASTAYDPYPQWNQFTTYGYSTSSGSAAAGATGSSHSGK